MGKTLKLYGLPRSATTVGKWLIRQNLDVAVLASVGGSKHGPYCLMELGINVDGIVLVTKNPYAWLWSVFKWAKTKKKKYQCPKNFHAMLRSPIVSPNPGYRDKYHNPVVWFNMMNYHWLSVQREPLVVLRHEDIVLTPVKALQAVAAKFGLAWRGKFKPAKKVVRASAALGKDAEGDWDSAERAENFAREFYVKKQYMANFKPKDIKHVNAWLDKDVMERLGYTLEKGK